MICIHMQWLNPRKSGCDTDTRLPEPARVPRNICAAGADRSVSRYPSSAADGTVFVDALPKPVQAKPLSQPRRRGRFSLDKATENNPLSRKPRAACRPGVLSTRLQMLVRIVPRQCPNPAMISSTSGPQSRAAGWVDSLGSRGPPLLDAGKPWEDSGEEAHSAATFFSSTSSKLPQALISWASRRGLVPRATWLGREPHPMRLPVRVRWLRWPQRGVSSPRPQLFKGEAAW